MPKVPVVQNIFLMKISISYSNQQRNIDSTSNFNNQIMDGQNSVSSTEEKHHGGILMACWHDQLSTCKGLGDN